MNIILFIMKNKYKYKYNMVYYKNKYEYNIVYYEKQI